VVRSGLTVADHIRVNACDHSIERLIALQRGPMRQNNSMENSLAVNGIYRAAYRTFHAQI
jgi:hypothetical protein